MVKTKAAGADATPAADGYEDCIVSFIDVLGFRELLKKRAADVIRILKILRRFASAGDERARPRRTKELRTTSRAFSESVSDAVVRIRVYDTQYRDDAFFHEMIDLLHAQIDCVNNGVLIRAGVAVGRAHVWPNGEGPIFGDAMVRAYRIESEEAVYPRIVSTTTRMSRSSPTSGSGRWTTTSTRSAATLMACCASARRALATSTTSAALRECYSEIDYYDLLRRHADLIRNGLETTKGRVRRKYVWLSRYHDQVVRELLAGFRRRTEAAKFEQAWDVDPIEFLEGIRIGG